MKFEVNNETLTIFLSGRIDSASAPDVEAENNGVISANPHTSLVFDADALEFISSAGLRVILRVLKSEPTLKIINASTDVYDIFDMTGFTEMLTVEKGYRRMSVDGCTVIGRGAKGTVYRY
ncbi:MAG: STAS domain-containing protein, partial [Clostridiales bacterium]|nr:STAS domain-containing protein [Candidatus Coliplasma equi]